MPDRRKHRGPNPRDLELFAGEQLPYLRQAVADLSLLRSMGYPENASLKLVGDRFELHQRQRMAVARSSCSEEQAAGRRAKQVPLAPAAEPAIEIDGFNLLITIESALAGGIIIVGQDGAFRDIASLHGTFRSVEETIPALELIGAHLGRNTSVTWLLDRPVSNSGNIKRLMDELAASHGWTWQVDLVPDPDKLLKASAATIVSADSVILDHCQRWANLARDIILQRIPGARVCDLRTPAGAEE